MRSKQTPKINYTALLVNGEKLGVGRIDNKWILVSQKGDRLTTKTFPKVSRLLRYINRKYDILPIIFALDAEITRKTSFDDTKSDVVVFNEV
tara:strand:- start:230 stop:505 length:276 start_codon:yes stop_codon:yes gene_type:complete